MLIVEEIPFTQKPAISAEGRVTAFLTQPLVRVQLTYNHKISRTPVNCLVDSGADHNLFPAHFAEAIGVPVKKGRACTYIGIGNSKLIAYSHFLTLTLTGTSIAFKTKIDFSYEQQVPLLGRVGFFNYFQEVLFDEQNEKLVLKFSRTGK